MFKRTTEFREFFSRNTFGSLQRNYLEDCVKQKNTLTNLALFAMSLTVLNGCGQGASSYSTLPVSQSFSQSVTQVNNKVDVLWVVDNSSSMTPFQQNLVANFNQFISNFQSKGYDFQIAVTSTDAYLAAANYLNNSNLSRFKDGAPTSHSGVYVINSSTPNLVNTFVNNASLGQTGDGDERAFQSIKETLNNSLNAGFLRSDAFLAVIILSDEDDFSDPTRPEASWSVSGGIPDHDYSNPNLQSVDSYVQYLDQLTGSTATNRKYNVSAITVLDNACLTAHQAQSSSSIIGQRYMTLANDTNGVLGSICDSNYGSSLQLIQQRVIELSTQFHLTRTPVVSSISIKVDGQAISADATNGWTYDSATNTITFHGTAIPQQGASIEVNYDPTSLTF